MEQPSTENCKLLLNKDMYVETADLYRLLFDREVPFRLRAGLLNKYKKQIERETNVIQHLISTGTGS